MTIFIIIIIVDMLADQMNDDRTSIHSTCILVYTPVVVMSLFTGIEDASR